MNIRKTLKIFLAAAKEMTDNENVYDDENGTSANIAEVEKYLDNEDPDKLVVILRNSGWTQTNSQRHSQFCYFPAVYLECRGEDWIEFRQGGGDHRYIENLEGYDFMEVFDISLMDSLPPKLRLENPGKPS